MSYFDVISRGLCWITNSRISVDFHGFHQLGCFVLVAIACQLSRLLVDD